MKPAMRSVLLIIAAAFSLSVEGSVLNAIPAIVTCNQVSRTNNSYFVNPDDTRSGSSCSIEVEKVLTPGGVCQLRLDFIRFDIAGPNFATGQCLQDSFTVAGATYAVPTLCGLNHGQHIYVDVRHSRSVHLTMTLGMNATLRSWKIRVTQIPCISQRLAPVGCLQYFEDPVGNLKSFNYDNPANDSSYPLIPWYQMCFREPCMLQLSQVGAFGLGQKSVPIDQNVSPGRTDTGCYKPWDPEEYGEQRAYLQIDNIRFCRDSFVPLYQSRNPVTHVVFVGPPRESRRNNQNDNAPFQGFNLQYRQSCSGFMNTRP